MFEGGPLGQDNTSEGMLRARVKGGGREWTGEAIKRRKGTGASSTQGGAGQCTWWHEPCASSPQSPLTSYEILT